MSSSESLRPAQPAPSYRPDIDGLRAVAVVAVVLFHCGVPGFSGGYVGVDVFFVISGYLITGHLAAEIAGGRLSILRFYERRIRRIVPALFVTLLLTWLAAAVLLLPPYLLETSRSLVAAALSVSNIYFWRAANYFAVDSSFQPLLHTWSLSVEEQFYLFIPVLMALAAPLLRARWVVLFASLCAASFALSVYATTTFSTANFFLLPTRAWELGLGSLLATTPLPRILRRRTAELAGIAGLLLILAPVVLFTEATPFPGINALYPCLGSMLLIHVGRSARSSVTVLLSTPPFVALGLISYSLYLVHWPIISLLRYRAVGMLDTSQVVMVLAASLVLATLSWRFVEQPFRRPSPALTQRRVLLGGVGAIGVACLVGLVGIGARGFPARFPDFTEQAITGNEQWMPDRCFFLSHRDPRRWSPLDCTRVATGPHRVLLWGDSFAAQYVPGLVAQADTLRATVIQYTAAGCLPLLSSAAYAQIRCQAFNGRVLDILREQRIDTVLIAGRWSGMKGRFEELAATLATLDRQGVRTVMIGQSPEFPADVQVLSFLKGSRADDAVNRWPVLFSPDLNQDLAGVAGRHRFVDPMSELCTGPLCTYQERGTFLFEDFAHYSVAGSIRVVRSLLGPETLLQPGSGEAPR
ncbi:acyltransferase family protein [Roseomonas sp. BN140053]|uniref:acyltransferase family protein n=1 Tax=Roseomonas sp. BN140053 TaxID=3391898 RepID=UPI0039E8CA1F